MSKILSYLILGGLVIAAIAAINVNDANASEEINFVQFSVLAQGRADYGADQNLSIPAVSAAIVEDKLNDLEPTSAIPVIKYTGLPAEDAGQENGNTQPGKEEQSDKKEAKEEEKRIKEEEKLREKEEREEEKIDKQENRKDNKDKKETKSTPGGSTNASPAKEASADKDN
jgi:hypothetical protein